MRILAIDLGTVRTGLAVCDEGERLASPIGTVTERNYDRLAELIAAKAAEWRVGEIVLGHPRNMDGTRGESARRSEAFAELLRERYEWPVQLWDERMTTVSATGFLNNTDTRGKKRKAIIDTVSAVILLENYLDSRRHQKEDTHA